MKTNSTWSDMPTHKLGGSGPTVSRLALGTMTFGAETDEAEAFRQMDLYVDRGGNFIDTADVYSNGMSEEIIGKWGKQKGGLNNLVVATKCRFSPPVGCNGASRKAITKCIENSLRRLQIDRIDLYYIHGWDQQTELEETLSALFDLITQGKILNIAWSNVAGWQLQKIIMTAKLLGVPPPIALQPQYNLLDRGIEVEVLPCSIEEGIGIVPWSPLGGGWLTGKYSNKVQPLKDTRLGDNPTRGVEAYSKRNTSRTYAILDALETVAQKLRRPMSHVAIAWLMSRPGIVAPIIGARTAGQLEDNLCVADLVLDQTDVTTLTRVSAPGLPEYPYEFLEDWCRMEIWQGLGSRRYDI